MPPPGTELLAERERHSLIVPISKLSPELATRFESTHCSDGSHNGFHVTSCDLSSKYLWVDLVKRHAAVIHWNSDLKALGWEVELTAPEMSEIHMAYEEYDGERRRRRVAMEKVRDNQATNAEHKVGPSSEHFQVSELIGFSGVRGGSSC